MKNVKLMTTQAVAEVIGSCPTLSSMGRRGEIHGAIVIGKHVRFNAGRVNEFLVRDGNLQHWRESANPSDSRVQTK